jgi:formylglycine-generating enzyme required for sulfatase activity
LLVGLAGCFFAGRMNRAKPPQWSTAVNGPAALSAAPNPAGATPAAGKSPYPTLAGPFRNSLGMKFVPVAGTSVLFGIWDVRVRDFEAFVNVSGYPATNTMQSLLGTDGTFLFFCDTWRNPDFVQGPTHPVCGVSWDDARAFCDWLTQKERREGRLNQLENYRLPTSAEWSIAAGNTRYPWGGHWPPPPGAGNFAGMDAAVGDWPTNFPTLPGYRDGYPRTSPVGSFPPNQNGLYDMGGNVMQWCMDWYHNESKPAELKKGRVSRGSSWFYGNWEYALRSASYLINPPSRRLDYVGFRCVLCNVPR